MQANFVRICTLVIMLVVVIAGGIVCVVHPETLSFKDYVQSVGVGVGLLGIGYGIDNGSKP